MTNYLAEYQRLTQLVEEELCKQLPVLDELTVRVTKAMRYSVLGAGKRVRAVLLLNFCALCGGSIQEALPFAAAMEMIHAYSLIHDDLPCMDDDELRRGKPSCHIQFGEFTAVLAGDALLNRAFETMLQSAVFCGPKMPLARRAMAEIASASGYGGMVGGQIIDLESEGRPGDAERLLKMYALKTGSLIRASVIAGAVLGGADERQLQLAGEYAEKIGLAFQIVDDILDITGSTEELGKPVGSDAQQEKVTFATLFGVEKSRETVRRLTDEALGLLEQFTNSGEFLLELTRRLADRNN